MPDKIKEIENNSANNVASPKKARLGRGLGSLLGGSSPLASETEPVVAPVKVPAVSAEPAAVKATNSAAAVNKTTSVTSENSNKLAPNSTSVVNKNSNSVTNLQTTPSNAQHQVVEKQKPSINEESQLWQIQIDRLQPNTQQPRRYFSPESLRELSNSIREKGILQPITARRIDERNFEIIAGERRWRAAQLAGLHEVPVLLKKVTEQDSLELAIIENIQRQDLNAVEEAEAYEKLMKDYGLTQAQVADKVGKERATVANSIRLLSLASVIKEMLKQNEISAGHAKAILGIDDLNEQVRVAQKAAAEKMSVRAVENLVNQWKKSRANGGGALGNSANSSPGSSTSAGTVGFSAPLNQKMAEALALELQKRIGTKVSIDYLDAKGKLSIHFYSDEQLNTINEKLKSAWPTN